MRGTIHRPVAAVAAIVAAGVFTMIAVGTAGTLPGIGVASTARPTSGSLASSTGFAGLSSLPATGRGATSSPRAPQTHRPSGPYADGAGFWLDGRSRFHRVDGVYRTNQCVADLCPNAVEVLAASASEGLRITRSGGGTVTVRGATTERVTASLHKAFPSAEIESIRIDGLPAVRLSGADAGGAWAFVLVGSRLYGFRGTEFYNDAWQNVREFTRSIHFFMPSCWMTPCPDGMKPAPGDPIVAFDPQGIGTWVETGTGVRSDAFDDHSVRQFSWRCARGCEGYLRVSIGTTATGPLVAPGNAPPKRVAGADVDALRAAWSAAYPTATFTPTKAGETPALVARDRTGTVSLLFVHGPWVVAITANGWLAWDPASELMVSQFFSGLRFHE